MQPHAHGHMDALCFGYGWMMTSLIEGEATVTPYAGTSKLSLCLLCFHAFSIS